MIATVLDVISAFFLLSGSLLSLAAAIGVVRFSDTLTRMHPAGKPQVVGLILVAIGAIISLRGSSDIWMLVLAGIFTALTTPVIAYTVARVAYHEQRVRDGILVIDTPTPEESESPN
ncbi:monovalent cation/H(+) antiporter subunit G [Millisia brevis]|uniref:monovalent cation/H(+) antiporter subunit G n=1 Tax=Millisia brevis TaxID=264148 RepID=UPI003F71534E